MLNSMTQRMATASAAIEPAVPEAAFHYDECTFGTMAGLMQSYMAEMQRKHGGNLFTTDAHLAEPLADVFLSHLPEEVRQDHNCNCCRGFLKRFGGLAVIDDNGFTRSVLWGFGGYPRVYAAAVATMLMRVERSRPTGVFLSYDRVLARPHDGSRIHFSVMQAKPFVCEAAEATHSVMARKRQDFLTLKRALAEFSRADCNRALTFLAADALYRGEAHVAPVRFLIETHDAVDRTHPARQDAMIWQAVAEAPVGWCSPRSTMVGALISDIKAGKSPEAIKRSFADKKDPTKYKRPQALPAAGNVAQAEKLIADRGLASALDRRFLRRDEVKAIWTPKRDKPATVQTGVFAGVQTKEAARKVPLGHPVSGSVITWAKFTRDVLPDAKEIEVYVDTSFDIATFVTADDPDAKPILRWDFDDERNPASWYVYASPRSVQEYAIWMGWNRVDMVSLSPTTWGRPDPYCEFNGIGVIYIEGAYDKGYSGGVMLFPEILKGSLHSVRSTIEQFSGSKKMAPPDPGTACGLIIRGKRPIRVRVTTDYGIITHIIDRLE